MKVALCLNTDLPCIISGDTFAVLDPHKVNINCKDDDGVPLTGTGMPVADLCNSFGLFSCYNGLFGFQKPLLNYKGTIFRFPLRSPQANSKLSETVYSCEKVIQDLFQSLRKEAAMLLLFLKNLTKISLYKYNQTDQNSKLLLDISLDNGRIQSERDKCIQLAREWKERENGTIRLYSLSVSIRDEFEGTVCVNKCSYLMLNSIGTSDAELRLQAEQLKVIPWVGIAAPCSFSIAVENCEMSVLGSEIHMESFMDKLLSSRSVDWQYIDPVVSGHTFCFLPIPNHTGLPISINGYFSIADNRRSIKWPMHDEHSKGADFNKELVMKMVSYAYAVMITCRCQLVSYVNTPSYLSTKLSDAYGIWPLMSQVTNHPIWSCLVEPVVKLLIEQEVVWTAAGGGKWVKLADAYYQPEDLDIPNAVIDLLLEIEIPFVVLPAVILESLNTVDAVAALIEAQKVTPVLVRKIMKEFESIPSSVLDATKCGEIFSYILSDFTEGFDGNCLVGINIIPLMNKEVKPKKISNENRAEMLYLVPKEKENCLSFLTSIEDRIVSTSLPNEVFHKLERLTNKFNFNICFVDERIICQQLLSLALEKWQPTLGLEFSWHPGVNDHPPLRWIFSLWKWLANVDLNLVKDYAIVPQECLYYEQEIVDKPLRLLSMSKCYLLCLTRDNDASEVEKKVADLLETLGLTIIVKSPGVFQNSGVYDNMHKLTPEMVIKLLPLNKQVISTRNAFQWTTDDKKVFLKFLSKVSGTLSLTTDEISLIKELPLFRKGIRKLEEEYGALSTCSKFFVQQQQFDDDTVAYPVDNVLYCTVEEAKFLIALNCTELSFYEYCIQHFIPFSHKQSASQQKKNNLWLLSSESLWCNCDKLTGYLCNFPFIPTAQTQTMVRPNKLYDPEDPAILRLFDDCEDQLPAHEFRKFIPQLRRLGLMTWEMITENDEIYEKVLFNRAQSVLSVLHTVDKQYALKRSREVVTYLIQYLSSHDITPEIKHVKFLFCSCEPMLGYPRELKWAGQERSNEVFSPSELYPYESDLLVGGVGKVLSDEYSSFINCEKFQHLLKPLDMENIINQLNLLPATSKPHTAFSTCAHAIYKYFSSDLVEFEKHCHKLCPNWVWIERRKHFEDVSKFAMNPFRGLRLEPFCYAITQLPELLKYEKLFSICNIPEEFPEDTMIKVMSQIQKCGKQLSEDFLNIVLSILDWVHKANKESGKVPDDILIPTEDYRLLSIKECIFDDRGWSQDLNHQHKRKKSIGDHSFTHQRLPLVTATFFGVKLLSKHLLPSINLKLQCIGPHQSITGRIKEALEDYDQDIDVFKELIQNAEDAGASEIKFVIDWRNHPTEYLLTSEMAAWQGPALLVYNNAVFSDEDFINICEIAGASKKIDPTKIGRFGVGFCSVYHITDVPSFVSRNFYTVFDPNSLYLGERIDPTNPGVKIDFINNKKENLEEFKDQFSPYSDLFDCKILQGNSFNATLFRFPFRTEQTASKSKICNESYGDERINNIVKKFFDEAKKMLTFLSNLKSVSLSEIKQDDCINCLMHVEKQYESMETVSLVKSFNSNPQISVTPKQRRFVIKTSNSDQKDHWVVSSCIGDGKSLEIACSSEGKQKGLCPLGEIAVKFDPGFLSPCKSEGSLFCFMPVPIKSKFNFLINGYFDISRDRRSLKKDDKGNLTEWNTALIQDSIAKCFLQMLAQLTEASQDNATDDYIMAYYSLWPCEHDKEGSNYNVILYSSIRRLLQVTDFKLLWSDGKWICPKIAKVYSNGPPLLPNECKKEIFSLLLKYQYPMVDIPNHVRVILSLSAINYRMFCEDILFKHLEEINAETRDRQMVQLLKCSSGKTDWEVNLLMTHKCISTRPKGILKMPKDLVDPTSDVADLYSNEDECFPAKNFCEQTVLDALKSCGMVYNNLSIEQLKERAGTVSSLPIDQAYDRSLKLVKYIALYCYNMPVAEELADIQFLPILKCPNKTSIPWFKYETQFEAPCKVYSSKYQTLMFSQVPLYDPAENISVLRILKLDNKTPSATQVVAHLTCLINHWHNNKNNYTDLTNKLISESCWDVYAFLQKENNEEFKVLLKEQLSGMSFVWHNNQFLSTDSVVLEWRNATYLDYLCEISQDVQIKEFQFLFQQLGINKSPTLSQCISVLKRLHDDQNSDPLPSQGINFCCGIANYIASKLLNDSKDNNMLQQLYLPDTSYIMRHIKHLAYKESGIENSSLDNSELLKSHFTGGTHWLHRNFSGHVARKLGIPSALDSILHKISDDSFFDDSAYGQQEDLCDRINSLLDKYPSDSSIFKEFIQNAEDAEASEIAFILDHRELHAKDGELFSKSENWSSLHNCPSLLIYNNKTMTEKDLIGITKLGRGSKQDSLESIGRFGVGFNVAYHITDCPMFVSYGPGGVPENFCVLDPTCQYAPRATKGAPGQRWKLKDQKQYVEQFHKQLSLFLDTKLFQKFQSFSDKCMTGLEECNSGCVVFRLPLTKSGNLSSKLLPASTMSADKLKGLLESLSVDAHVIPLFIKNLKCISAFEISKEGKCSHYFTTTVHIDRRSTKNKEIFSDKVNKSLGCKSADVVSFNAVYQKTIEVTIVREGMNKTKTEDEWLIAEQFGSTKIPQEILEVGNLVGLTPLGGVAIQVNYSKIHKDCKIFCSLPLPLKSYLPLHVNGHFWVDDSRKHLEAGANNSPLSKWNEYLTTTVISSAYLAAIEEYCEYIDFRKSDDTKRYYSIFPHNSLNKDSNLHSFGLTQCVYASIINSKKPVLQKKQILACANKEPLEWMSMNQARFLSDMYKPSTGEGNDKLSDVLLMFQLDLTNAPLEMYNLVKMYNLNCPNLITPIYLLKFLKSIENIKQFENLIIDNIELLLTYCLQVKEEYDDIKKTMVNNEPHNVDDDNDDDNDYDKQLKRKEKDIDEMTNLLTGVPLLLTTDGHLKKFDHKCPVYHYRYAEYFPHRKQDFVDHRLETCEVHLLEECKFLLHVDVEYLAKHTLVPDSHQPVILSNEMDLDIHNFWKCLSAIRSHNPLLSLSVLNCKPIILGNDNYLYPLSKAKMVVYRVCDNSACNVLIKLGYPTLDTVNEVAQSCISLFNSLVASPEKGDDILQCIQLHQKSFEGFDTGCFSEFDKDLCRFLNTLSGTSLDSKNIDYVTKLPIYKIFDGKYEALRSDKQCILLPRDYERIPTSGFHKIVCKLGKQILIPESGYVEIYKCLDLKPHSMSEIYINFIFKHIACMDESDIVEHMEFLRTEHFITEGSSLAWSLQEVPFMEGKTASEYFDPDIEVFSTFLTEDYFPPSPWNSKTWLPILRIIGLQLIVTGEKLIEFAHQAERMEDTEKVRPLLKAIAKKIVDCCENHIFPSFCAELVSINFIPTFIGEELQCLLQLFTKQDTDKYFKQTFVSFRNAILPKHEGIDYYSLNFASPSDSVIDWLVGDLAYGRYHQNFIINKLQIRVRPCCLTVVNNLLVLSELVASSVQSDFDQRGQYVSQLEKLFMHHYYFLEKCSHVDDIQPLKNRPFIFINKESEATFLIVSSSKMVRFISDQQDYSPYLFRVPKYFSQYVKLIDYLDISDQPTSLHFAALLKEIYCEFHNSNMFLKSSPTCLPQAENAYYELIRLLRDNNANSDQQKYCLLGEDNELYHQDELVYNDAPWYSERIKKGFACNFIKQPLPDKKGKHTLPDCLKVPLLSSLLTEEIQQSVRSEENECHFERLAKQENTGDHGCEFIKTLNYIVKSKQFKIGLKRIIYHETKDIPTQTDEAVINTLDNLQFKCYHNIPTVLRSIKTNEVISGSEKDVLCAIYNNTNTSHNQEGGAEMLVACHSSKPDEVVNAISQKLNTFLNNMVKDGLCIIEMIKSGSLNDIEIKLDQLHVQPYHEGICSSKLVVGNVLREAPIPSDQVVFVNFSPEEMVVFWNPKGDGILAKVKSIDSAKVNIKSLTVVTDGDNNAINTTTWCISKLLNPSQVQNLNLNGDRTKPIITGDLLLYRIPHKSEEEAVSWIHDIIKYCNNVSHQQKCFILKRLKYYTHYYLMICNNAQPAYQAVLSILNKAIADIDKGSQNESTSVSSSHQGFTQQISYGFHFSNAFCQPQRVSFHRSRGTMGVYSTSSGFVQLNAPHIRTAPWDPPAEIETRPQVNLQEAQIWYCQASADFQTCEHLIYTKSLNNPSNFTCQHPALLCFLSRQVVEKCLKALCLATCGLNKDIQDAENIVLLYNYLSSCLNDKSLEECVHQVSEYDRSTRFPDAHVPSQPPCCVYDEIDAYNAFIAAEKVIKYVKDKLNDDQGVCATSLVWSTILRKGS